MFNLLRKMLLVSIPFLLVACATKKEGIENKQASLYFGAGTQSLMDQEYTEALTSLIKANQLEPKNTDILNNLGMAYYFKGESELAIKYLNQSLELDPKNSDAKINLGTIYYQNGDIDRAEKLYKIVMKDLTYDKQARTFYNLGILEMTKRKNLSMAETYFVKAIKEDSNYCPAYYNLGTIQYQRQQFKSALRNFKEASTGVCLDMPNAHYQVAMTHIMLRNYTDARIKLDEINTRFNKTVYAVKARTKLMELNDIENSYKSIEARASRKVLESPDF